MQANLTASGEADLESSLFDDWVDQVELKPRKLGVRLLTERNGRRDAVVGTLANIVIDHLIGADVLARLGYAEAASVVRSNLPRSKRARSADLGEILATEYVISQTSFLVPFKRLRYRDDREVAMRGDDIIGLQSVGRGTHVLKGEVKSRANLGGSVVAEACTALESCDNRPKPATLAFISRILRIERRDSEAEVVEALQTRAPQLNQLTHLIFTVSGNDPKSALRAYAGPKPPLKERLFVGLRVEDHQAFIASIFERLDA